MAMIREAYEMRRVTERNEIYSIGYKKAIESVMNAIEKASKEGNRKTCFNPSAYWYTTEDGIRTFLRFDDEVKQEFIRHGYTFVPTGYVGGVWQRTEDICW